MDELTTELKLNEGAFMPYPVSTLSPKIIPNDLSTFKSRGISQVERDLQQKLIQMREEYIATIEPSGKFITSIAFVEKTPYQ